MKLLSSLFAAVAVASPLGAQTWESYYPEPSASTFTVSRDIRYVDTLRMDVYRPANSGSRPALVFFTAGAFRNRAFYTSWARIAASKGVVAVLADLRGTSIAEAGQDFRSLLSHVQARGAEYGIDTSAIAVFGGSSNGFSSFQVVQDPRETRVKASVIYYSGSDVQRLRGDLPVLYIRAGLDRPFVNGGIDSLVARALAQNAPITVVNYAGGHHAFEGTDDNAVTRTLIDQTIDFVKSATSPAYRESVVRSMGYAAAAAHVQRSNFREAAAAYGELVAKTPNDAQLRLAYGEALLGDRQFEKACAEFEKLKGKGLGPRDLGLPAARACLQKGDPEAAIAWLASIPKRFLPARVKDEPVFVTLKDRADFKALFQP